MQVHHNPSKDGDFRAIINGINNILIKNNGYLAERFVLLYFYLVLFAYFFWWNCVEFIMSMTVQYEIYLGIEIGKRR
jgi:hypothetical protein